MLELSENVTLLESEGKRYYVVGTAHISHKSVEEVEHVIDTLQPDTVCVELCATRHKALTDDSVWKQLDIFQVIRQGKTLFLLSHIALSMYQRRMGEQFGIQPGAELMAAVRKADEIGATLVLIDRDVQITLKRTWGNLSFFQKASMLMSLVTGMFAEEKITEEELEKLKEEAQLQGMLEALSESFPEVKESLIDERDQFMISSMKEAPGENIVTIVGAGHVPGMKKEFPNEIDRTPLNELPKPNRFLPYLKWLIPAIVLGLFFFGLRKSSGQNWDQMLYAWVLPNSIMCALFAIIARAKPLTILVAFLASPITSLNPALGAGMLTGLTEAWLRKPTVADCERINQDITSFRGLYKNAFTHVLLVAVLTNMGSALGAYVGLSQLLRYIF